MSDPLIGPWIDLPGPPAEPEPAAAPSSSVTRQGEAPIRHDAKPPTHVLWRKDRAEIVAGEDYDAANPDLEPLPDGYDEASWRADPATRTFTVDWSALDAQLHAAIDEEAGRFRCRFITDIPGQTMTYLRKETEARAILADGPGPFPMLEAQAAATGVEIADLAGEVAARADEWIKLGAAIEGARHKAKQAVSAAEGEAAKREAAKVDWAALAAPGKPVKPLGGAPEGGS